MVRLQVATAYAYFCAATVLPCVILFLLPYRLPLCYCNASFSGYSSICFPVLLLLTCAIPAQIKRPGILSNNYHCVSNSSMRFSLLTVALPFFTGWVGLLIEKNLLIGGLEVKIAMLTISIIIVFIVLSFWKKHTVK